MTTYRKSARNRAMQKRFSGGANRDKNEDEIVTALEARGCLTQALSGKGVPDRLVFVPANQAFITSRIVVLEIKNKKGRRSGVRQAQAEFYEKWHGAGAPVFIVSSVKEALYACFGELP